jgi:hypothetical protein
VVDDDDTAMTFSGDFRIMGSSCACGDVVVIVGGGGRCVVNFNNHPPQHGTVKFAFDMEYDDENDRSSFLS